MSRVSRILLAAAVMVLSATVLGLIVCQVVFGLSQTNAMIGFTAAFTGLIVIGMIHDRQTEGVWFLRRSAEERVALDGQVKHARWGYVIGSTVMLPAAVVMLKSGIDSNTVSTISILVAAGVAAGYFRHGRKEQI